MVRSRYPFWLQWYAQHRSAALSDYFLSRVTPRADVHFSQLEAFTQLDPSGQQQTVWQLCEMPAPQEENAPALLFRRECYGDLPAFYVLSRRVPVDQAGLWQIESQPYAPQLAVGDHCYFKVRANPVVSRHGQYHDVIMEAYQQAQEQQRPSETRPTLHDLACDAGVAWMTGQAESHGFALATGGLLVENYQAYTVRRRGMAPVQISTLDFSGVFRVTDAARCTQTLYDGLGQAKGWGCGLLLVKRVVTL
jgi:CRISPR system Cascade subunit CasE